MGQIQSSVGLITGIPILDTVDKLMAISARPRDLITARNEDLQAQQVAVTELTSLVLGVKFATDQLGTAEIFAEKNATSSNPNALSATVTGDPTVGTYQFTPVRKAQAHQLLSSTVGGLDDPLGAGSLTMRFGGFVDEAVHLDRLNGGGGVDRGWIRITDRSGASAVVDLRFAQSVDDVLETINGNAEINITAVTDGDGIRLLDNTSQSVSNLIVQEVGTGATAADLGLAGINVAAAEATGQDVLRLHDQLQLAQLNDGTGVDLRSELPDLEITFADESPTLAIDLGDIATLGDLLQVLNEADPTRLSAAISSDGDHLELTDLTSGAGTLSVRSALDGTAAEDLGLTGAATAGVVTSGRLQAGLKTVLLNSLGGGQGLGPLGLVDLTDRSGATSSVDLAAAETLDDVIELINDAGIGITAGINAAGSGIELTDTSGGSGNLVVANGDATATADLLGITIDAAESAVDGGSLNLQTVSRQTLLSVLNGGAGVHAGSLIVTDTAGHEGAVKLNTPGAEITTVGGVIDAVNAAGIGVTARLNDQGDGILLVDSIGAGATLTVREVGNGTTAADLGLLGDATTIDLDGTPTQVIDGSATRTIEIAAGDTLDDLIGAINDRHAGVEASRLFDGSAYRLLLTSHNTGGASRLQVDTSGVGFNLRDTVKAQDALLVFGSPELAGASILVSSAGNTFDKIVDGIDLTVQEATLEPVTVDVGLSDTSLLDKVEDFVDAFNQLRDRIDSLTFFNEVDNTTGILFGSNETLRVETELANLVTGRFANAGDIHSAEALGIGIDDQGKLSLDKNKLEAVLADDRAAVEEFFTAENAGFADKFDALINALAGEDHSLLASRAVALADKIDSNNERVTLFDVRLEKERQRLLAEFFHMEAVVGQMQNNLAVLRSFQALPPLSISLG